MFFDPAEVGMKPPPFKHTVYNALVVPRPIGWISTVDEEGIINLAPFSFFNSLSADPPCVMFCPNGRKPGTEEIKDTLANVEKTKEFVYSMCTYELRGPMVSTAVHEPANVDELAEAGLEAAPCERVRPPRVKESPIALECTYMQTVNLPNARDGSRQNVVIGQVVGIHIDESVITDGIVDVKKVNPLARLGYLQYAQITAENVFDLSPPGGDHRYKKKS